MFAFKESRQEEIKKILKRYPEGRQKSALLPLLHLAQEDNAGWLSVDAMDHVASVLDIKPIEVYEVASFYTMFHLKPVGRYVLEVCRTGPCCLVGAEKILEYLQKKLNIKIGETTADGLFTLKTVECLAACGYGPVLQIGPEYYYYENLTEEKVDELIDNLKKQADA